MYFPKFISNFVEVAEVVTTWTCLCVFFFLSVDAIPSASLTDISRIQGTLRRNDVPYILLMLVINYEC